MEKLLFLKVLGSNTVLFQDKPQSVIYIEECLINPPVFPGTQSLTGYMNEVHLLSLGGFENREEISERVGEVLGSLATMAVLATCIIAVRTQSGSKREIRKLNSAFETLLTKLGIYRDMAWSLNQHPFGGELDKQSVAIGMLKSQRFLASSTEPDVVLESEFNVGPHLVAFRYEIMKNFPPSFLREKLWEGIKEITGVTLDSQGLPNS
jgi:hypothetical protein